MRKHFYLITDHDRDEDKIGQVQITDTQKYGTTARKNEEGVSQHHNLETGERWTQHEVGLGYVDFEHEEQYERTVGEVTQDKLAEIDEKHLEKAGLDPDEVLNGADSE